MTLAGLVACRIFLLQFTRPIAIAVAVAVAVVMFFEYVCKTFYRLAIIGVVVDGRVLVCAANKFFLFVRLGFAGLRLSRIIIENLVIRVNSSRTANQATTPPGDLARNGVC